MQLPMYKYFFWTKCKNNEIYGFNIYVWEIMTSHKYLQIFIKNLYKQDWMLFYSLCQKRLLIVSFSIHGWKTSHYSNIFYFDTNHII